jgi:hypothetical protein
VTRPTLDQAISNKLAKRPAHDPEQLTRAAKLAIDNPGAYADLPAHVREAAALYATAAPVAPGGQA